MVDFQVLGPKCGVTISSLYRNTYKPRVPFLGHRQTVQTKILPASDQGLHCLLTGISIRNRVTIKTYAR